MTKRMTLRTAVAVLSVGTGSAAGARAQETADTFQVQEIVVTVTRRPIPLAAAPVHVTIIDGAELRDRGVDHVLEALRTLSGASVVQTGSFGGIASLFLRGGESDYVQVLVDGVPVNEPGGAFDWASLAAHNVERIEVVRGPASALYGSDAMTGVVQIFTRRGRGRPQASLDFKAGTFGTLAWIGDLSGGTETAGYSFSLSRFTSDGAYAFNNEYDNTVLSGRVALTPDDRTDALLSIRYGDNEFHRPTDGAGNLVERNAFEFQDRLTLGLELGRRLGRRLEGRLLLASHATDGGTDDRQDDPADTLGLFAFQSLDHVRRLTADARLDFYLGASTVLSWGVEIERQTQRSFSNGESQFGPFSGFFDVERSNRALYAQAFTDLDGGLAVTAGARLEDNDAFGSFATYRLGAVYRLPVGTRVRAAFGTGLKEPTFFENFATGFVTGNPSLDPERARSWEVGAEQSLADGRLRLSATYFHQRFRDLIQFTFTPPPGEPNFFNVAAAMSSGIEAGLRFQPVPRLDLSLDYTFLETEVEDAGFGPESDPTFAQGAQLLRRPKNAARLHAAYRLVDRGYLSLMIQHVGARDDLDFSSFPFPRVRLPSYTRLDLAGLYEIYGGGGASPSVSATLRLENALDRQYEEVKNFSARGRTLLVGGRLAW